MSKRRSERTDDDWDWACGDLIGRGSFRTVYAKRDTLYRVIKVANAIEDRFHNYMEWMLWNRATPKLRRYLAPVYAISPDGQYLEMARTDGHAVAPNELVAFIADSGLRNCGRLLRPKRKGKKVYGRIVSHDYSLFRLAGLTCPIWYSAGAQGNVSVFYE